MEPMRTADPALAARAAAFDAGWLVSRRWFRSKSRRLAGVEVRDAAPLGDAAWLVVLEARHADGGADRYLVPAAVDANGNFSDPRDGDGAWRGILAALVDGEERPGAAGRFQFQPTDALDELLPGGADEAAGLVELRLNVEQSNTSVRLGDRLMLKVYRMLEPGTNPEVEVYAFLTEVGFPYAPALAGWVTYAPDDGEPATAAMAQALVASRGDAWQWALNRLADPPQGPAEALAGAAAIGGITAEMHEALASRPERPDFPAALADARQLAAWRQGAERQLDAALEVVPDAQRARLEAVAGRVRGMFAAIEDADAPVATRIHGDYHLGQLLRTESSFIVIDFEGEPARPLAERRRTASPLRDVAGILRSLDYAARTAERDSGGAFQPDAWLADARSALLAAYGPAAARNAGLLTALEAEKACYEVCYEANNRPDWTWLPIAALERLAS